ncbi:MAG: sterol desaturase family protein [Alphaproteobacteria bacterium]|nr:sterol desaturase family protein [Alphaproteobacteria bacterium]MDE2109603.1 sterol desaturase family protein [Alphaproteobacteria bacterium]MDE2493023.1 sterol desaturase family protein [Alphaproteobacteria bacterium]
MRDPVSLATPVFIVLVVAEMVYARLSGRARFEPRDTAASLLMGFGSVVVGALFAFVFLDMAAALQPYRLAVLAWSWPALIACFVLDDFVYYWWHRASHRVRWLWADHVNHHSSQHYNLSTALRQPWSGQFTPGVVFRAPLVLLGFPIPMIVFVHGLNLVYQFWIHTEAIDKLPRFFEAVMNTPSHHRVHHATNPAYLDSNYAGVFIIWDRMFGSFVAERAEEPPRYGIVHNLASFNVFKIAFHEWLGMFADLFRARSAREALCYVFAPPGWSPDGSRDTTDSLKAQWAAVRGIAAEQVRPISPAA